MGDTPTGPPQFAGSLHRYVPRVASEWDDVAPGSSHRVVEGTLVFVDISGFTSLTERLSQRGRIGAEELTAVLNHVFGAMLERAYARGGSLLKFGGDALLVLFEGSDHALQGCAAALEMRAALREAATLRTSVGRIALRMTVGVRSGPVDLYLVGASSRELIVVGPAATEVVAVEGAAEPGQILVSASTRALVPADFTGIPVGPGWLLRKRKIPVPARGAVERLDRGDEFLSAFVPVGLRTQLGSGLRDPEHKAASVAFVAFKGIEAIQAAVGPEGLAGVLDHFIGGVQAAAESEGITFLSSDADADGGKVILTGGVPGSLADAEGRVLRAAAAVVAIETPLVVKIGITTGHLFVAEAGTPFRAAYTVMGDIVNTGARLMAAAPRSHVYASPLTLQRSLTLFRTEALAPIAAKGKAGGVIALDVFESTGRREAASAGILPFVGRREEIQAATGILAGPGPRVLTIVGDTGIGKSRLVDQLLGPDRSPFVIRGEPAGQANPYWALRDPVRALLEVPRTDQQTMARDLTAAVARTQPGLLPWVPLIGDVSHVHVPDTPETAALEARNRPERTAAVVGSLLEHVLGDDLTVVVEDLHWLDEATLSLLSALAAGAPGKGWGILATGRLAEDDPRLLGTPLPLGPLPSAVLQTAAERATADVPLRPALMRTLVDRADGNPLFLIELLAYAQTAADPSLLPDSLAGVVSSQIDTLAPLDRQLLRHASVLGRSFRAVVLDRLIEDEPFERVDRTMRELSTFLEPDGEDRIRFRTAVAHDAAYQALSFAARRALHARAGGVIEELAGNDVDAVAEFLAEHFARARMDDKAWTYAQLAADHALLTYANQTAEDHYRSALEAGRRLGVDPAELGRVWTALGDALQRQARFPEARAAYAEALRRSGPGPIERTSVLIRRAQTWLQEGSTRNAKRAMSAGRRAVDGHVGAAARTARARIESVAAAIAMTEHDAQGALTAALLATELGEATGDPETLARACTVLDWATSITGTQPDQDFGEKAIALYEGLNQLERAADVMNNKGGTAYLDGNWSGAIEWYRRSIEASRRAGSDLDAALGGANVVELLVGQRRFDEADELIHEVRRTLVALGAAAYLPFVDVQLGRLLLGSGRVEEAVVVLTRARELAVAANDPFGALEAAVALALARAIDDPAGADDALESAVKEAGDLADHLAPSLAHARASIAAARGETHEATVLAEAGLATAREHGALFDELRLLELLGELDPDAVPPDSRARRNELADRLGVVT